MFWMSNEHAWPRQSIGGHDNAAAGVKAAVSYDLLRHLRRFEPIGHSTLGDQAFSIPGGSVVIRPNGFAQVPKMSTSSYGQVPHFGKETERAVSDAAFVCCWIMDPIHCGRLQ